MIHGILDTKKGDEHVGRNIFVVDGKNRGTDRKNGETDAAALAWETGMKHGEILQRLKEMEEKNWLVTYEIDMCCGEEYIVDGLTDEGKAALAELKK